MDTENGRKGAPKSSLERLEKRLDSRATDAQHITRSTLGTRRGSAQKKWETPVSTPKKRGRRLSVLELVFIFSIVFFVIAGAFASFLFFSGNNTVSTRNVNIAIDGPTEIRAGDVLPLQIVVTNQNTVPMELTDLIVEFPAGTRSETDVTVELPRIRDPLGTIRPGESVNRTVRSIVFGQADTTVEIKVSVEYRVPSSNAIFFSEGAYTVPISQSPASITIESLKEIVSGQETAFTVTVKSNISDVLQDMLLVADYPPGFSFSSSVPAALTGSNTWRLGDIEGGGERKITVRGVFSGEDGDERVIHFTAGTQNENRETEIAAPLATGDTSVFLAKPFVSLTLSLDGQVVTETTAQRGVPVRGDIRWVNNLPTRAQDVEIEIKLNGDILDRNSVVADRGFWRSQDNTIVWSRESNSALTDVAPGATDVFSFSFTPLAPGQGTFRSPEIVLNATVRARRVTESRVPEVVESTTQARVLVETDLAIQAGAQHAAGPFPPKADNESIYTISWVVTNSANSLANTKVSAVLPSYVQFKGNVSPNNEQITNAAVGGVLTWDVGDLEAGQSRNVTFQVGMTPSLSQVNTAPPLISGQRVSGFDRFTRTQLERTAPTLTTGGGASAGQGNVVE